jgi:hypothetical protein
MPTIPVAVIVLGDSGGIRPVQGIGRLGEGKGTTRERENDEWDG